MTVLFFWPSVYIAETLRCADDGGRPRSRLRPRKKLRLFLMSEGTGVRTSSSQTASLLQDPGRRPPSPVTLGPGFLKGDPAEAENK